MKTPEFLKDFYYHLYEVTFDVSDPRFIPRNPHNLIKKLRGSWFTALKEVLCRGNDTAPGIPCRQCNCQYRSFAHPIWQGPADLAGKYRNLPSASLIRSVEILPSNLFAQVPARIRFQVILIGETNELLPFLIPSFNLMAREFLKIKGATFSLKSIAETDAHGKPVQEFLDAGNWVNHRPIHPHGLSLWQDKLSAGEPNRLSIEFPGMWIPGPEAIPVSPGPSGLFTQLLERIRLLSVNHCGGKWEPYGDWLETQMEDIHLVHEAWEKVEWKKYQSRRSLGQSKKPKLQTHLGLKGSMTLEGPALPRMLPLLNLGQFIMIGKLGSMGMGGYRVRLAEHSFHRQGNV